MASRLKPYMPLYVEEKLTNLALRGLSPVAFKMWFYCTCEMWRSERRGYLLQASGCRPLLETIALATGVSTEEATSARRELIQAGIFKEREDGALFDPDMLRQVELSLKRSRAGKRGADVTNAVLPRQMVGKCCGNDLGVLDVLSLSESKTKDLNTPSEDGGSGEGGLPQQMPRQRFGNIDTLPSNLDTPRFRDWWVRWRTYQRNKGIRVPLESIALQLAELSDWGEERACKALENSIRAAYVKVVEPKASKPKRHFTFEEMMA